MSTWRDLLTLNGTNPTPRRPSCSVRQYRFTRVSSPQTHHQFFMDWRRVRDVVERRIPAMCRTGPCSSAERSHPCPILQWTTADSALEAGNTWAYQLSCIAHVHVPKHGRQTVIFSSLISHGWACSQRRQSPIVPKSRLRSCTSMCLDRRVTRRDAGCRTDQIRYSYK